MKKLAYFSSVAIQGLFSSLAFMWSLQSWDIHWRSKNTQLQWLCENEWTYSSAKNHLPFPIWPSQTITLNHMEFHFHTRSDCTFWKESKILHQLFSTLLWYGLFSEPLVLYYVMLEVKCQVGMLVVLLDDSSINRLFSNFMKVIDYGILQSCFPQ